MKVLKSLSNFIWVFIIIGIILFNVSIFPSEQTPSQTSTSGNEKFIYELGGYVVSIVSVLILGYLSSKIYEWLGNRKTKQLK
jgi:hypothetical protein